MPYSTPPHRSKFAWTPELARTALATAISVLVLHYWTTDHGESLRVPTGTTIQITRTFTGWIVEDGRRTYPVSDLKVMDAPDHD